MSTTHQPTRPGTQEHPPEQDAEAIVRERLELHRKGLDAPLEDWDDVKPKLRKLLQQPRP
jgi:hypothetical protein